MRYTVWPFFVFAIGGVAAIVGFVLAGDAGAEYRYGFTDGWVRDGLGAAVMLALAAACVWCAAGAWGLR